MRLRRNEASTRTALFAAAAAILLPCSTQAVGQIAQQINLVTDSNAFLVSQGLSPAVTEDPNLINPWGLSHSGTSPFWISNQETGTSTLYTGNGVPAPQPTPLIVTIPTSSPPPAGPTGQAFTGASGFQLVGGGNALFAFANLDGSISAWNGTLGNMAAVQNDTAGAVFTGLAVGSSGGNNYLYAANNAAGTINVFDQHFQPVTNLAGSFQDPNLPAGLSPFNVVNVGGQLFVTYAAGGADADEQDLGTGAVDIFSTDGTLIGRFATGGNLLSPWGVAVAPSGFDSLGGDILIGNFSDEDGFINIFDPGGNYLGMLTMDGDPFNMPYLWALDFRTGGAGVDPNALYFTAGIGDEEHGLFAELLPVPEPSTWAMMLVGFGAMAMALRGRARPKAALA